MRPPTRSPVERRPECTVPGPPGLRTAAPFLVIPAIPQGAVGSLYRLDPVPHGPPAQAIPGLAGVQFESCPRFMGAGRRSEAT